MFGLNGFLRVAMLGIGYLKWRLIYWYLFGVGEGKQEFYWGRMLHVISVYEIREIAIHKWWVLIFNSLCQHKLHKYTGWVVYSYIYFNSGSWGRKNEFWKSINFFYIDTVLKLPLHFQINCCKIIQSLKHNDLTSFNPKIVYLLLLWGYGHTQINYVLQLALKAYRKSMSWHNCKSYGEGSPHRTAK